MIPLICHICGRPSDVESLERAELAGWSRSSGGWICESYDCYMSCEHRPLSFTAPGEATPAAAAQIRNAAE